MLSAVQSPSVSSIMAASPSITKFGSSFLKAGSSFFLKKGATEGSLPLTRPLLPPSLSQLSQQQQPAGRPSTDSLQPRPPAPQPPAVQQRPSASCLKSNYIELPPPSSKCSGGQSIINGTYIHSIHLN